MYKINFRLSNQISFIDRPCFDGILAYAYTKEKFGTVQARLSIPKVDLIDFIEVLPIRVHEDGYFMASQMNYDETIAIEQTASWKKRWANQHDFLADFGKSSRKIDVGRGQFKSYDMPINLLSTNEVWFFFESDDPELVYDLIGKHIFYLGKKRSQGYGEISSWDVETVPDSKIVRPIPTRFFDQLPSGELKYCAWKPPYWLPDNFETCIIEKATL